MDLKELNKSQLILLTILVSFITSIATGVTVVSTMQQAPTSITVPINKVVKETVEKIVPVNDTSGASLSKEQKQLLEELKAIKPLTVSLYQKGINEDKLLGTGLFLGNNRVVIASLITPPAEGEKYIIKSILGEQEVFKVTQEKDFTIIEVVVVENIPATEDLSISNP